MSISPITENIRNYNVVFGKTSSIVNALRKIEVFFCLDFLLNMAEAQQEGFRESLGLAKSCTRSIINFSFDSTGIYIIICVWFEWALVLGPHFSIQIFNKSNELSTTN